MSVVHKRKFTACELYEWRVACALAPAAEWWVQLYLIHCVTLPNFVAWAVAYTVDVSKYLVQ